MSDAVDEQSSSSGNRMKKQEVSKFPLSKDSALGCDLWTDGLICAFEFIRGHRLTHKSGTKVMQQKDKQARNKQTNRSGLSTVSVQTTKGNSLLESTTLIDLNNSTTISDSDEIVHPDENKENHKNVKDLSHSHWIPIGWTRISELVQMVQTDASWNSYQIDFTDEEDDITVADVAAPYWERPVGPTWWCHVHPGHPYIEAWLNNAQWLHPAISTALRDESRLISERMKHLLYEVPVRVAGGLLFELLGQSVGDPFRDEDDIPIVLRSWQAQNFLITAMHIKGSASNINVLGITEVQELLLAGGSTAPKSVHEVIAHLTSRLARWDDRECSTGKPCIYGRPHALSQLTLRSHKQIIEHLPSIPWREDGNYVDAPVSHCYQPQNSPSPQQQVWCFLEVIASGDGETPWGCVLDCAA